MKKLIAILLTLAICFTFVSCGGTQIPDDYTVITDVQGVTFAVPNSIAELTADNENYAIVYSKSKLNLVSKEELAKKYVLRDKYNFGYLTSDELFISVIPLDTDLSAQALYDSDDLDEYISVFFDVTNVKSSSQSLVALSTNRLTLSLEAKVNQYGLMNGQVVIIQNGDVTVGIMVLATEQYKNTVGEDVAKETVSTIAKSIELTGESLAETTKSSLSDKEEHLPWF
jgi:hypothetical protein